MNVKIFGREPVAITAAIQAALALMVSFGWLEWMGFNSQGDVAAVVLVLTTAEALYIAYVTNETLLAPVIAFFKAILSLGAVYGFGLTDEQTGTAIAVITAVFGLLQRTQVSPLEQPTFKYVAPGDTGIVQPRAGEVAPPGSTSH